MKETTYKYSSAYAIALLIIIIAIFIFGFFSQKKVVLFVDRSRLEEITPTPQEEVSVIIEEGNVIKYYREKK